MSRDMAAVKNDYVLLGVLKLKMQNQDMSLLYCILTDGKFRNGTV